MTRYYFHIRRRNRLETDHEGVELPSNAAALAEAVRAAKDALVGSVIAGEPVEDDMFEVCNERGDVFIKLPFKATYKIH
jgi:hypothetical protein